MFAVAIVNVPMARLRLFAPLRRRFACWRPGHRSTIPSACDCGLARFIPAFIVGDPRGRIWQQHDESLEAFEMRVKAAAEAVGVSN
jgi:hypothetical protein